jgi:hypothetical protein
VPDVGVGEDIAHYYFEQMLEGMVRLDPISSTLIPIRTTLHLSSD